MLLENLDLTPADIAESKLFSAEIEQIDPNSIEGLLKINDLAGAVFAKHPDLQPVRDILGQSDRSRKKVLQAIIHHSFPPREAVDPSIYQQLLQATHQKEELSRGFIQYMLEDGATFGLNENERQVLKTSCEVGGLYDRICFKWFDKVRDSEVNSKAKESGLVNPYSVIVKDGEGESLKEIPYGEFFNDEISIISGKLYDLIDILSETVDKDSITLSTYFTEYISALVETDLTKVEDRWREVDRKWLGIKGRWLPVGFREEGYYDPNAIRVFPDFRLALRRDELKPFAEPTRQAMIDILGRRFGEYKVYQETKNGLENVAINPIDDIVYAGSLDFQPTGQSLPNDEKVRNELGTINMLNFSVIKVRWSMALDLAKTVFPDDYHLFEKVDPLKDGFAIAIAGHEFGEPLFDTDEVKEALGKETVALLNEDLADLTITGIIREWEKQEQGGLEKERVIGHLMFDLGVYLRFMEVARGQEHLRAYYKAGLLGLERMRKSGFIYKEEDKWRINPEKADKVYEYSEYDLDDQVYYAEYNRKRQASGYLDEGEETGNILDMTGYDQNNSR